MAYSGETLLASQGWRLGTVDSTKAILTGEGALQLIIDVGRFHQTGHAIGEIYRIAGGRLGKGELTALIGATAFENDRLADCDSLVEGIAIEGMGFAIIKRAANSTTGRVGSSRDYQGFCEKIEFLTCHSVVGLHTDIDSKAQIVRRSATRARGISLTLWHDCHRDPGSRGNAPGISDIQDMSPLSPAVRDGQVCLDIAICITAHTLCGKQWPAIE